MDIVQKMKRDWNRRASHHARFWIATEDWQTDDAFADSGRETAERIRRLIGANWQPGWRALEIGCGIGRVMRALAPYVAEIHGVDVSADMIRQSHEWLAGVAHARTHENSGVDLALFDAAYLTSCTHTSRSSTCRVRCSPRTFETRAASCVLADSSRFKSIWRDPASWIPNSMTR